jgi:hypothetical protein
MYWYSVRLDCKVQENGGQEIEFAVFAYERAPVAQLARLYSEASAESRSITSLSRWPSHWDWGWKAALILTIAADKSAESHLAI